jgi:anthranilate phosphoribosyltransferase
MDLPRALALLVDGRRLARGEAESVMRALVAGTATPAQIGALLVLLRSRGETIEEIVGFATVLREVMVPVRARPGVVLDTCGTGGDGTGTFNVSTLAALVTATAGVQTAKHGNRAVSSRVGSADLLEGLGIRIELAPSELEDCLRDTSFAFLFAPRHHPSLRHAAAPRRELGMRTVFNLLGPLANPAGATHQVLGVPAPEWVEPMAEVLRHLGSEAALVVHATDGQDEVSTTSPTTVAILRGGRIDRQTWQPEDFGVARAALADLRGGSRDDNVAIARRILRGESGPLQDAVAVNAGAALYIAGARADVWKGTQDARLLLESGQVERHLARIVECTARAAGEARP